MTKRRRMPVNVLQDINPPEGGAKVLDGIVGGAAAPVSVPTPENQSTRRDVTPVVSGRPTPEAASERTRLWLEARRLRRAEEAVGSVALASAAVGLVPWPLAAVAVLVAIQVGLIRRLASEYGVPLRRTLGRSLAASVVVGAVFVAAAGVVGTALRLLPVVGQVSAILCLGLAAAASTAVIGKVFIKHFEAGETLLDLNSTAMKEYFARRHRTGPAEHNVGDANR